MEKRGERARESRMMVRDREKQQGGARKSENGREVPRHSARESEGPCDGQK